MDSKPDIGIKFIMAYRNNIEIPAGLLLEHDRGHMAAMPVWKRILDLVLGSIALLVLAPAFLLLALAIKMISPGPSFYKQTRIGYKGELFTMYKFRTMHLNAPTTSHKSHLEDLIANDHPMEKLDDVNDPRIFRLGTLLRKTGIDELPQLLNVLKGEMSIVGPRPCLPYEAAMYKDWQKKRFLAVPGITGLWQVNGKNNTTFTQMIHYDIEYINHKSLWMDIKIIFSTIPALLTQ